MNSLKTIQTLSKIGQIISKIVYICCMVGFIACAVGIVAIAIGGNALVFDDTSLNDVLNSEAVSMGTALAAVVVELILCAGEYVVSRMAYRYFDNELNAGTPFTFDGAKELMRLGIFVVGISIGSGVLAQIAHGIISAVMENVEALPLESGDNVAIGIMLIVISLFCRYGAELAANQSAKEQLLDEQN